MVWKANSQGLLITMEAFKEVPDTISKALSPHYNYGSVMQLWSSEHQPEAEQLLLTELSPSAPGPPLLVPSVDC